jgi:6-hydroxycyclohex-1-ene-1-carbonyl-CoA dehydrogenase
VTEIIGFEMREPGGGLHPARRPMPELAEGEILVRVAGCGVCHTDLGFLDEGVKTRRPPPLILGHEISGIIEETGARCSGLRGRAVVVPAVIPCGECPECRAGRPTICRRQVMPGNDRDGGFASHVVVPGRGACIVPGADGDADAPLGRVRGLTLRHFAVVADAVSTAYQAVRRSDLARGDVAVVFGLGGVGGYVARLAASRGAAVVAVDPDPRARTFEGALPWLAIDPKGLAPRDLRAQVAAFAVSSGSPDWGWKIFECSGTAAGQTAAFGSLVSGATLMVVGFTREPVSVRLSNLMAFDARALGNWGCAPELYPEIVDAVLSGELDVVSRTVVRPLSAIADVLEEVRSRRAEGRVVLAPDL